MIMSPILYHLNKHLSIAVEANYHLKPRLKLSREHLATLVQDLPLNYHKKRLPKVSDVLKHLYNLWIMHDGSQTYPDAKWSWTLYFDLKDK
jgi:hypothetical protein